MTEPIRQTSIDSESELAYLWNAVRAERAARVALRDAIVAEIDATSSEPGLHWSLWYLEDALHADAPYDCLCPCHTPGRHEVHLNNLCSDHPAGVRDVGLESENEGKHPNCPHHEEVQHLDFAGGRSFPDSDLPWCNYCGWNRGNAVTPARKISEPIGTYEQLNAAQHGIWCYEDVCPSPERHPAGDDPRPLRTRRP